jgi:LPPG:FO 2-phospho-L-lactate transferase
VIVGIGGGIGASRLWRALVHEVGEDEVTLVVNTADDIWMYGLRVCPDIDTNVYALSGRQDLERGWGLRGESFRALAALRELGEEAWFGLGDLDVATHMSRTGMLRAGVPLTEVTRRLALALGTAVRVLPMSDGEVTTTVTTSEGERLHYQEFFVRRGACPVITRVEHEGAAAADPSPGVLEAIAGADLVVIGPCNPLASIAPVLALPGVREALRATPAPVVAVTPIVSGIPIVDPGECRRAASRAALLRAIDLPATATSAACLLREECDVFVLDEADAEERPAIASLGLEVAVARTLHGPDLVRRLLRSRPRSALPPTARR